MVRTGFVRRSEFQDFALAPAVGHHVRDFRLAFGERARLVEGDAGDRAERLQHRPTFQEEAAPGPGREPGRNGRRRGNHERTLTANEEDSQPFVDPRAPGRAEEKRRGTTATSAPTRSA